MGMYFYKSKIQLNDEMRTIVEVNIPTNIISLQETTNQVYEGVHYIHILDRSGSMSSDISELMDNVKKTISVMNDNDLISLIWFSGEGQFKTLLKGASVKTPNINELIDSIKSTIGCTCFSDPLKECNTVIDDLISICPNITVTLFTDGCPCVNKPIDDEINLIFNEIDKMKDKVISINTIAYGNYCDEKLLEDIASKSMLGRKIHSNKISDYLNIFRGIYDISKDVCNQKCDITTDADNFEFLYMSRNTTKYTTGNNINVTFLNKKKNQFFIIGPDDKDFKFTLNDEVYDSKDINTAIHKLAQVNFLYGLSYEYAYLRKPQTKYLLAKSIKDKYLADHYINAFTADERQNFLDEFKKAIFSVGNRYREGECLPDYLPPADAFSVIDLFNILNQEDNCYYVPTKDYNRIGRKVTDTFNLFNAANDDIITSFKNLVWNESSLNLSLRYMIEGTVKLNPKQAKKVDLDENIHSKIYRNQTIIKDGCLNVEKINIIIPQKVKKELCRNTNFKMAITDEALYTGVIANCHDKMYNLNIDLTQLPIINDNLAKNTDSNIICTFTQSLFYNKAKLKVLKFIKSANEYYTESESIFNIKFTPEQIEVLKEHGLNDKLEYVGVNNVIADKNESDFYMSKTIDFTLSGWSALPPVCKVVLGEKLNKPGTFMHRYYEAVKDYDKKTICQSIKDIEADNYIISSKLAAAKLAKILSGTWWDGLTFDEKKKYYTKEYDGDTVIIKTSYTKKYF